MAKVRYNRLLDIFTGITCFTLQSHWRTTIRRGGGQSETDELYVGVDKRGLHFILPVQAKVKGEKVSLLQAETDFELCANRYPGLVCRPIAVRILEYEDLERDLPVYDRVVCWEFAVQEGEAKVAAEKHYLLVPPQQLAAEDLASYAVLPPE